MNKLIKYIRNRWEERCLLYGEEKAYQRLQEQEDRLYRTILEENAIQENPTSLRKYLEPFRRIHLFSVR